MLFFALKEHTFLEQQQHVCPKCHKPRLKQGKGLAFLSFGLIPLFPYAINSLAQCSACRFQQRSNTPSTATVPLYHIISKFIGALLLCILCIYLYNSWQVAKQTELNVLQQPQVNDFYFIDYSKYIEESYYQKRLVVAKVVAMDEQTVLLAFGNHMYFRHRDLENAARLSNFVQDGYFSRELVQLEKQAIFNLFEQGKIYQAHRPRYLKLYGGFVLKPQRPAPLYKGFHPNKANQEGIAYFQEGLYKEALEQFLIAAEQGDEWGQLNAADMYHDGNTGKIDLHQALDWYQKAAAQGNKKASKAYQALCESLNQCTLSK